MLTCNLAFAHFPPQCLGLAFGPVLELLREAPEELVLAYGDGHAALHIGQFGQRRLEKHSQMWFSR